MPDRPTIFAEGLFKSFGDTHALRGVGLDVAEGTILALLGPNGAGKTTAVRILATLLRPDAGRAEVAGVDVLREPARARTRMGLAGQYAALDEVLTGRENLEMIARLFRLDRATARRRAAELLERFDLVDAADRVTRTYSGGMRRRLDLAGALVATPPVLFLDEPTTGLDPRSRLSMWDMIGELARGGTTVLMTTQYLEEADRLAHDIVVIDHGQVIARGTAAELKQRSGGERLEVVVSDAACLPQAAAALSALAGTEARVEPDQRRVTVPVTSHGGLLTRAVRELDGRGVELDDIGFRRPTLDEVFLALTGRPAEESDSSGVDAPAGVRS
ncbi:MAG TPA: ATP-binding cassette domain-containing protein [candidate division Zixibacteria bacterium]|nr:ATP-binding cassette domain-containing protein [candidate division Zixibacteria bacterium]